MKQIFTFIPSLFIIIILLSTGCTAQTESPTDDTENEELLDYDEVNVEHNAFANFDFAGEIHNTILEAVFKEYTPMPSATEAERDRAILALQLPVIQTLRLSETDKEAFSVIVSEIADTLTRASIMEMLWKPSIGEEVDSVDVNSLNGHDYILYMFNQGNLSEIETGLLCELARIADISSVLTGSEIEDIVDELIVEWTYYYGDTDYFNLKPHRQLPDFEFSSIPSLEWDSIPEGAISGLILNLSKHSLAYWNRQPNAPQKGIICDTLGAIIALKFIKPDGLWSSSALTIAGISLTCSILGGLI